MSLCGRIYQDFLERIHRFVADLHGVALIPDQISAEVDALLSKAKDLHLKHESDIARLATLLLTYWGGIAKASLTRPQLRVLHTYRMDPD